ncbi:MAG TPA: helix-turn-helix transcriptional regulator [Polyangiaceae bacterium]|jgi:transcriptional regulator with XRE-family HTH domain
MMNAPARLMDLLVAWRTREDWTQEDAAEFLYISARVYGLFERGRWRPSAREIHFFAHTLGGFDPALGEAVACLFGMTPEALGLGRQPVPALTDAHARAAYDASVYAAAEEARLTPTVARAFAASLLARLRASGITLDQAAQLAGAAPGAE